MPEQEKITTDPDAALRFSSDSVAFDTVFTAVNSITRRLKDYNDNRNAVEINRIYIENGPTSPYTIAVNGDIAQEHESIRLLGRDSLLILVDIRIDPKDEDTPFLVTDKIRFETNGNSQEVNLVAYGQDAVFINGDILDCNTTWTSDRPYVIYNSVLIDSLCSLTIEPGARIYSHNASYIFVQGSLVAGGTVDEPIVFSNDRFDDNFINAPGQWGGIVLLEGSNSNMMDHVRIRNARVGVYIGTPDENEEPDITISNAIIENMGGAEALPTGNFSILPGFGLLAFNSDVSAYNVLINNCEFQAIGNYAGGNYVYRHCTFANYSFDFFRQGAGVLFSDNLVLDDNTVLENPLNVTILNSIIWGNLPDEIEFSIGNEEVSELVFSNNIIRTEKFTESLETSNFVNTDPEFIDPEVYNYKLMETSPAIDAGLQLGIPNDLDGQLRDDFPDLGAYENQQ
ncbi:MAG: choice-of-anchor Q domain-containing protein [Cyclobacteriaceae bacterium]